MISNEEMLISYDQVVPVEYETLAEKEDKDA
jgi:hypothetical protein